MLKVGVGGGKGPGPGKKRGRHCGQQRCLSRKAGSADSVEVRVRHGGRQGQEVGLGWMRNTPAVGRGEEGPVRWRVVGRGEEGPAWRRETGVVVFSRGEGAADGHEKRGVVARARTPGVGTGEGER